jgi:ABC-type uncharacterized transport system auxiliary subunit
VKRGTWVLAASLAAGCASKLPRTPETFTIDAPAARAVAPEGSRVVSLRRVEVSPPYSGASLTYRTGAHAVERDPYASFAAPPSWVLTAAIGGYIKNSGLVRDVVAPAEGVPIDAAIEPLATELAGDFTNSSEPAAVLTLQFRVLVPAAGPESPARVILLKTYTRRLPLSQRTARAVVAAWNQALGEIMDEFLGDLRSAVSTNRP